MKPHLELRLLGSPILSLNGQPLEGLPSRSAEGLLMYLALQAQPISREFLAELLWNERPQQQALANLRSILSSLRKAVRTYIVTTRQTVAFNRKGYFLDVEEFEREMAPLLPRLHAVIPLENEMVSHLETVLDLYRGDFLEGFYLRDSLGFEEWATLLRERFRRMAHTGFRAMVRHALENRNYLAGIRYAERLIAIDPYDEDARRQMMTLLLRNGQRNAALRLYEALCQLLLDELDVEPTPATNALYERYRALSFPPPVHLPVDLTSFLGRDAEITDLVQSLMAPHTRLVTLFGPGGIGKTRLSVEVARRITRLNPGWFLDGVAYVSLASIFTGPLMISTIADTLGIQFQGATDPKEQLIHHLQHKELLLILDNFEHFLGSSQEGVAILVSILNRCSQVKLLVTSRERLNLYEEVVFDVLGLDIAQPNTDPLKGSAVALFIQTARRVQRRFAPEGKDMAAVIHTCQLLQGVPLAIELAASWVRQHSPGQILERLQTNLDFLQSSFRNLPERHRSLRAVFDHSWQTLASQEQAVFCQLAVFEGGFTQEAVRAVVSVQSSVFGQTTTEHWKLNTENFLTTLADKSLIQPQADGRFTLHPLLRQFAAEKQAEFTGVLDRTPHHHAAYYLDFLRKIGSGEAAEQRAKIQADLPNIRTAWQWAAQRNDLTRLEQTAETLHNFYSVQSWFQEGIEAFDFAIRQIPTSETASPEQASVLCELLGRKARMHISIGQLDAAQADLERAIPFLQQVHNPDRRSVILGYLAISNFYAGAYTKAVEVARESLVLSEQTQNLDGLAFAHNFLGSCYKALGDYVKAREHFELSVVAYQDNQDGIGAGMVLNNLGNLAQAMSDFEAAQTYYRECIQLFKAHDHSHGAATALANAGKLALKQEAWDTARQLLEESLTLKQQINDQRGVAVALSSLGDLSALTGNPDQARKQFAQALSMAHTSGDIQLVVEILVAVMDFWVRLGDLESAAQLWGFARQHPALSQEARERGEVVMARLPEAGIIEMDLDKVVKWVLQIPGFNLSNPS